MKSYFLEVLGFQQDVACAGDVWRKQPLLAAGQGFLSWAVCCLAASC